MITAIVFDLDTTLTESKSNMTPEMGGLLARLLQKMPVAVMSGSSYAQFQKQFMVGMPRDANLKDLYLFPTSAAQCYTWRNSEWQAIYKNLLSPEEKTKILHALAESLKETGFDKPPPQLWGEQIEDRDSQITWSALGQQAPYDVKKVWDSDRKKRAPLQAALLKRLPVFSARMNATTSIDISKENFTKAYGVQKFSEIVSVPISDMLYVGDALFPGGNDEIVKETGILTQQVSGPAETAEVIEKILTAS
ncbi:MAG: HAD-IIB family hydrolase [Patescibacteria group bacterium]